MFKAIMSTLAAAVLLSACATSVEPETPKQRLALAEAQFAAVVESASTMLEEGTLSQEDAASLDPYFQQANRAIESANDALEVGKPDTAQDYILVIKRAVLEAQFLIREAKDEHDTSDQHDGGADEPSSGGDASAARGQQLVTSGARAGARHQRRGVGYDPGQTRRSDGALEPSAG